MFRRKLQSLDYPLLNGFDFNDSTQRRQLIAWIEDQKIRHYTIEDREGLRNIDAKGWDNAFHRYLSDIGCPFGANELNLVLDWIITLALRLEYEDNVQKYSTLNVEDIRTEPQVMAENPFDCLDVDSNQFREGVKQLAQVVKVPIHPTNHLITLRAVSEVIEKHISMKSEDNSKPKPKDSSKQINRLDDNSMPLKVGKDRVLANCAKVLRLLYLNDLRQLQTKINEIIASVQSITANPKTDTSMGKVGFK